MKYMDIMTPEQAKRSRTDEMRGKLETVRIAGKMIRDITEPVLITRMVFTINGMEYDGNDHNCDLINTYMHTNDPSYLKQMVAR